MFKQSFQAYRTFAEDGVIQSRFVPLTLDQLDPGAVVIQAEYSSINYKDALSYNGKGKIMRRFPCVAGIDVAGKVVASEDPRFRPGDPVICNSYDFGVAHDGGYAEFCRVPADWVVPLPKEMTSLEAMGLGVAGFTAALAVDRLLAAGLALQQGPVLVNGATGGVGSIAIEILAQLGYAVTALTHKTESTAYLQGLGATEVLSFQNLNFAQIRPLDKATWAAAVDNLGGDTLAWMLSTMKINGLIASIGLAASPTLTTTVMPFILRGVSLLGIDSVNCPMEKRRHLWQQLANVWKPVKVLQQIQLISFADLPNALAKVAQGQMTGRFVVEIA